jgi:hypothetical protein
MLECMWLGSLPVDSARRCLDLFFVEGEAAFYHVALALLQSHHAQILELAKVWLSPCLYVFNI